MLSDLSYGAFSFSPGSEFESLTPAAEGFYFSATPSRADVVTHISSRASANNVVLPMASAVDQGQVVTASSEYNSGFAAWKAFNGNVSDSDLYDTWAAATSADEWLAIDLGSSRVVAGYDLAKQGGATRRSLDWRLEGSNDGTNWDVLDTVIDAVYEGLICHRDLPAAVSYRHYRIYVTRSTNNCHIGELRLLSASALLIESGGVFYSAKSGALQPVSEPVTSDDIEQTGSALVDVGLSDLSMLGSYRVISKSSSPIDIEYIGSFYELPVTSPVDLSEYDGLVGMQFAVPVERMLVRVDGLDYTWSGVEWVLASDVETEGVASSVLASVTAEQWMQLYAGGLTSLSLLGFSVDDPGELNVTITLDTLNASGGAWLQCDASDVAIRWYEDKVTFTPAAAGNYKLAYQAG